MILKKKTKIVATIGPVSESVEMLAKMMNAGLNIIRMNFSHGDFSEHQKKIDNGRKASKKTGVPMAFLQDLSGPKIRTGEFSTENGRVTIEEGQDFTLTTRDIKGDKNIVNVNYTKLPKEIKIGDRVMVDDGKKKLVVKSIKGKDIICKVVVGGELKGRRGINLPDTDVSISSLTEKDKTDLEFGFKNKVDFFALSFVRRPSDVTELRNLLLKNKSEAGIIAKIETPQAVENIDEIISLSDGIMIARGDLAIEVPAEEVPLIQKNIINKCNMAGKPVITATQMLESMINSPVPTRAEVSDIANAILDGTDAVMLSEETTLGKYPLEAVQMMAKVARRAENDYLREQLLFSRERIDPTSVSGTIASHAVRTAHNVDAKFLVSLTNSGAGARALSKHRPSLPILAFTPNDTAFQRLILSFGCWVFKISKHKEIKSIIEEVKKAIVKNELGKTGDKFVVIAAHPFGIGTETNMMIIDTL